MAGSTHKEGVQKAMLFLQEKGLTAKERCWVFITSPNGLSRNIKVDTMGLQGEKLVAVVEVGGISNGWYFTLSPFLEMYHWPIFYLLEDKYIGRLAAEPHLFGKCVNCPPVYESGFTYQFGVSRKKALGIIEQIM